MTLENLTKGSSLIVTIALILLFVLFIVFIVITRKYTSTACKTCSGAEHNDIENISECMCKDGKWLQIPKRIHKIIGLCFILIGIIGFSASGVYIYAKSLEAKALSHGLESTNISLSDIKYGIQNSPKEDIVPKKLAGNIIIYYRFHCDDCEATYHDIKAEFEKNGANVYWISSRSKQGKKLLESYPVEEVPTGIYIRKNNYNDALEYTKRTLFTKTDDGKYQIDKDAITRLSLLQKEER